MNSPYEHHPASRLLLRCERHPTSRLLLRRHTPGSDLRKVLATCYNPRFQQCLFDLQGLIHERAIASLDRRKGETSLLVGAGAIVVELDFGCRLMASPSELQLKRLVVGSAAPKLDGGFDNSFGVEVIGGCAAIGEEGRIILAPRQ